MTRSAYHARTRASNRKTFRRDDQQESNKLDTTLASKENGVRNSFCARRHRNEILYDEEKAYRNVIEKDREREREGGRTEKDQFLACGNKKKKKTHACIALHGEWRNVVFKNFGEEEG